MSKQARVTMPDHVYERLKAEAVKARMSVAGLIRLALVRTYQSVDFSEPDQVARQESKANHETL